MGPLIMKISFGKLTFDTWMQQGPCLAEVAFIPTAWMLNFIIGKMVDDVDFFAKNTLSTLRMNCNNHE